MTEKELKEEVKDLRLLVEIQQEFLEFLIDRVRVLAMKNQISYSPPYQEKGDKTILDSYL